MTRYTYHCLFEQSGTFKNEFKNLGYEAYDYDILNEFGETDYVIDLYKEIEKAYDKKPSLIDMNRNMNGDYFEKPTQYWFINCEPKNNLIFEPIEYVEIKRVNKNWRSQVERSMIHPQYANRFIREFILEGE